MKDELKPLEKYLSEFSYNSRKPFYNDDSDYTTNSPSYYDDLARKNKLIKHLALRIWDYDKELAKRFAEWDKNLEQFDDEVLKLLQEWMDDGTFDEIINDHIFNDLNDQIDSMGKDIAQFKIDIRRELSDSENRMTDLISALRTDLNTHIQDYQGYKQDIRNEIDGIGTVRITRNLKYALEGND